MPARRRLWVKFSGRVSFSGGGRIDLLAGSSRKTLCTAHGTEPDLCVGMQLYGRAVLFFLIVATGLLWVGIPVSRTQ
jgi:hypothetical protein